MRAIRKMRLCLPAVHLDKSKTLCILQMLVAVLFLVGAALMCYVFVSNEWSTAVAHVVAQGKSVSEVLSAACEEPLRKSRSDEIQMILLRMEIDKRLAYVRVFDSDDRMVAQKGQAGLADDLATMKQVDAWQSANLAGNVYKCPTSGYLYYAFDRDIEVDNQHVGRVQVAFQHPPLVRFAGSGLQRGGIALFGVALLLMLGNYLIHVFVGPLCRLKQQVLEAQESQSEKVELDLPAGGEAGEIAAGIEKIVSNLNTRYRTLADSNRELQVSNRVILFEKRRTESIIDCLTEGVVVTDAYGRISLINHEAESLLQVDRKDVLGKLPAEVLGNRKELAHLVSGDQTSNRRRTVEFEMANGEGKKMVRAVWVPIAGDSTRGNSEKGAGAITMLRDVTQQKMEETARRDFISNVVHELRAPLSSIKSYVEMLLDNEADTPELRAEFFNTINEEADRLSRLIDNMLNISKIEVGGLVLNKSTVKTKRLLEDVLTSVSATAKSKNIAISASLPENLPEAQMDKELVRVVMTNLLGNAIKYTEPGGNVVLAGEVDDDELRVHVVDTGWGIPVDEQEKVFQKFYRGKRTGSEKVTGNGLGLALAREIACLHGGDLRLQSEEGKGSKFTLSLPLK